MTNSPIEVLESLARRAREAADAADQWAAAAEECEAKSATKLREKARASFAKFPPLSTIQRDAEKDFGLHRAPEYARALEKAAHLEGIEELKAIGEQHPLAVKSAHDWLEGMYTARVRRLEKADLSALKPADIAAAMVLEGAPAALGLSVLPKPTLSPAAKRVVEIARASHGDIDLDGPTRNSEWASACEAAVEEHFSELRRLRDAADECRRAIEAARRSIEERHIREHQARQPRSALHTPIGSPWSPAATSQ